MIIRWISEVPSKMVKLSGLAVVIRTCIRGLQPDLSVNRWSVIGVVRCAPRSGGAETEQGSRWPVARSSPGIGDDRMTRPHDQRIKSPLPVFVAHPWGSINKDHGTAQTIKDTPRRAKT